MGQAWGFGRFGGPEVQDFFDRPDPVPGRGEVLIRVDVAGVNPLDYILRSGLVPELDSGRPFPRVLGTEAAGTVLALGEDVDGLEVGDASSVSHSPVAAPTMRRRCCPHRTPRASR